MALHAQTEHSNISFAWFNSIIYTPVQLGALLRLQVVQCICQVEFFTLLFVLVAHLVVWNYTICFILDDSHILKRSQHPSFLFLLSEDLQSTVLSSTKVQA